jgi:hypothetical protein
MEPTLNQTTFDLTTFLAIWGAFLSTIAIGWNLFRDLSDKGKIRVTCFVGNIFGGVESPDTDYLVFNVTNVGKRPIMITQVGGAHSTKHFMITPRGLPKMLQPGEYVTEYTPELTILEKDIRFLGAWDSFGRIWKIDRKNLRQLMKTKREV